jgi:Excalibur calcium-binding domain
MRHLGLTATVLLATAVVSFGGAGLALASSNGQDIRYKNCTALNKRWPYGVGRWGARDRTSGTPVTNFKRSNILYRQNSHLDRDKDRVACEKR